MTVLDNTTTTEDIDYALDVEMLQNFNQDMDQLQEFLGIVSPEVMAAGTALYQYTIDGALDETERAEGDEVPLSKYTLTKGDAIELAPKAYRKLTTAEAVLKSGYERAVVRTDTKMLNDVRGSILADLFGYLANGTGEASGTSFQDALAQTDAVLADAMEENNDAPGTIVHFVNRFDIADYLGKATVSTQTAFGMTYIQSFLGIDNIFVTSKVDEGTIYATPAENLHLYGIDFGALSQAGLSYTTYDGSLIGVNHEPAYDRVSAQTHVLSGATIIAEILDYIVKGTVAEEA